MHTIHPDFELRPLIVTTLKPACDRVCHSLALYSTTMRAVAVRIAVTRCAYSPARLQPLASAVARYQGGHVVVVRVVVVPVEQPLSDGVLEARRVRAELDAIVDGNLADVVAIRPVVAVAYSLAAGIRTAAEEQRASLIVLGWQADRSSSERLFGPPIDDLLREPPCDVAVARLHGDPPWRGLLLPVRG